MHGLPTLPPGGKSAEYFPQNHGGRVFHATARRHAFAVKKPRLAARKIERIAVAFGSPQDFHIALMFGAARFSELALSGSRRVAFHVARRRLVRRWTSAHRTSASISSGFSTAPDVSPRHTA
jgi:hypothetical protein